MFLFFVFFAAGFDFLGGFLVLCFPVSLLFCFSALCFSASLLSLLLCFSCCSAFPASLLILIFCCFLSLLLCLSASLFSRLLCVFTSAPCYFYYSTFSFLRSCVFAALLPAPLLLCFLSFCLFVFHFLLLYSVLFVS